MACSWWVFLQLEPTRVHRNEELLQPLHNVTLHFFFSLLSKCPEQIHVDRIGGKAGFLTLGDFKSLELFIVGFSC
jgi:hypothetical protein